MFLSQRQVRADNSGMGISARGGLYKPRYIYDSQTISKFTDPRESSSGARRHGCQGSS
jgi:hypothetical protein